MKNSVRKLIFCFLGVFSAGVFASADPFRIDPFAHNPHAINKACKYTPLNLKQVVRCTPYVASIGFAERLSQIRLWVLDNSHICDVKDQHIFFDVDGRVVSVHHDPKNDSRRVVQRDLNKHRQQLANKSHLGLYVNGNLFSSGYPFTYSCHTKEILVSQAINRFFGIKEKDRFYGHWNGIQIGGPSDKKSLFEAMQIAYAKRKSRYYTLTERDIRWLSGQMIIESGARRDIVSTAGAQGLMQLLPIVLKDCRIPKRHWRHRVAQIDCAMMLTHRMNLYLAPKIKQTFGHLPEEKRHEISHRLTVQAYHGGMGNVSKALNTRNKSEGAAARYFAKNYQDISGASIATGLIFHNIGRLPYGMASIRYVTDVAVAKDLIQERLDQVPSNFR